MTRSPEQALEWAKKQSKYETGMCLQFTRKAFDVAGKYNDATDGWNATKYRHTSTPPPGVPVWWTGGSKGHGHAAVSAGDGYVISTDVPKGKVGKIKIETINVQWRLNYKGWSEDINDVHVVKNAGALPKPSKPSNKQPKVKVSAAQVAKAAKTDPRAKSSTAVFGTGTKLVEAALVAEGLLARKYHDNLGHFGTETVKAYAGWQKRLGHSGKDADGIPGLSSLKKLGAKYGFDVVA